MGDQQSYGIKKPTKKSIKTFLCVEKPVEKGRVTKLTYPVSSLSTELEQIVGESGVIVQGAGSQSTAPRACKRARALSRVS